MRVFARYWNLLARYLRPQWASVVLLAALILGHTGLQLINPQIVRLFIDTASVSGAPQRLVTPALLFLGISIAAQTLALGVTYLGQNVAWMATNALRLDLTRHCLRLDMSFHKTHTPGELIERIDGDVGTLANFFSALALRLLNNGLLVLGTLAVLFTEDWRIGLVGTAYVSLAAMLLRQVQQPATQAWRGSRQVHAELFGFLGERLGGIEEIRANGGVPHVMVQLYRLMRALLHQGRRARLMGSLTFIVGYSVFMIAVVATLGIGATLFLRQLITIGTVYLLLSYVNKLYQPLQEIQRQVADLQRAAAGVERVTELLNAQPTLAENVRATLPPGALALACEGVSFHYSDGLGNDGADDALADVTFELAPGQVLGLLGRTGSGKTTLTRLLLRLYDPDAGTIKLGGIDVRDVGLSDLRERVGMVTQEVQLFQATIRDNLTFFSKRVSDEQVQAALDVLGLWEWCQAMPHGLDTQLKAGGQGLSAGEAQLLALARVFLKEPGLVILDEASSRLDPATERLLEHAVGRLLQGRTAIVVAHRLTTVQRADEIMVLENGRVCEHGDRRALASDPTSRFHGLLQIGLGKAVG
jgi:ATP-binding cassette subfamily B protein/ATP-binding cassette subfamily C protein